MKRNDGRDRIYILAGIAITVFSLLVIFWLGSANWHYEAAFVALLIGTILWPLGILRLISQVGAEGKPGDH